MGSVNIIKDDYFLTCGLKLEGEIKQSCHDFEVREVHFEPRMNSAQTKSKLKPSNGFLDGNEDDSEVINLEEIIGSVVIARIANISAEYRNTLQSIHDGNEILRSAMMPTVAVLLRRDMSKRQRGLVHEAIKESHPFLKTAAMTADECLKHSQSYRLSKAYEEDTHTYDHDEEGLESIEIEEGSDEVSPNGRDVCVQEKEKEAVGIWVSADESLLELASTALSLQDLTALYAFKVRGPHHPDAGAGVLVGLGLSRDERTKVYRIVTSKCLSLDSKTVEDRTNKKQKTRKRSTQSADVGGAGTSAGDSKSMLIFWRKKASFLKGKSEKDSEILHGECGSSSSSGSGLLHLEFTLCKVNTEHLAALQLIAAAACVAIGDISFCGIKDKKAVTYQQCVLAIRTYGAASATSEECPTSLSAIAEECLKSVPATDGARRERAGTAIDCLLAAFPADHTVRYPYSYRSPNLVW
jgi:tRNA pseudouridine synthase D (TruD)